ncbi:hypothetical protein LOTGIDRAFT_228377 [Lottia gigantea]|uniref:Protein quiver n=1 Tax=Lottia gigantea TaxID=225164 RepID=V4A1W6_LOTGI|nr:hypothetical protein LOTGIDRAFT_228377 [Lottia gigantea]ESO97823.1 hypothetical protein LOTGIDRAFT_228377 [Lottia gigantea]
MESSYILVILLGLLTLFKEGSGLLLCHRCYSAMGGCGDDVNWRMYPWRTCGDSDFCVKVVIKKGGETHYIRECESNLLKSTRHRLQMPLLRRHNYCLPARKNDPSNPTDLTNPDIMYCFCDEYWGCNSSGHLKANLLSISTFTSLVIFLVQKLL